MRMVSRIAAHCGVASLTFALLLIPDFQGTPTMLMPHVLGPEIVANVHSRSGVFMRHSYACTNPLTPLAHALALVVFQRWTQR